VSGAFLERMTLVPTARGPTLEALYHRGSGATPVVLAPSRPELGSLMDGAVLSELCWGLTQAGHPTLRFNWAGVGASSGDPSAGDLGLDVDDLREALSALRETESKPRVAVVGYGHGAVVAARAAEELSFITRVAAVAPTEVPSSPPVPARVFLGTEDHVAPRGSLEAAWGDAISWIPSADHAFSQELGSLRDAVVRFLAEE
jgi:alpha/beta superfamily hydrolase